MTNPSAVCLLPSVVAGNSRLDYWTIRGYVVAAVDEPAGGFYVPGFAFFTRREVTRSRKCLGRCLPGGLVRVSPQTRCSLAGAARVALPPTRRGPLNRPHRATARGTRRDRIIVRSECGSCARSRSGPGLPGRQRAIVWLRLSNQPEAISVPGSRSDFLARGPWRARIWLRQVSAWWAWT